MSKPLDVSEIRNRVLEVRRVKFGTIANHPRNPKKHPDNQRAAFRGAVRELGFVSVPLAYYNDAGALTWVDGHLRGSEVAEYEGEVAILDINDAEADKLLLYADPIAALAEQDAEKLGALLRDVQTGDEALQAMLAQMAEDAGLYPDPPKVQDPGPQVDRADELRQKWGVEPGMMWALGEHHRLICGDCTDAETVQRVMGGEKVQTLFFDPEWDAMPAPPEFESALVFTDGARMGDAIRLFGPPVWVFTWDCVSCWYTPNRPLRRTKHCLWYGDLSTYNFDGWHYGDAGEQRTVWNTRGEYTFTPDPRGKHLADLYSEPITKLHAGSEHSHSKPLTWVTMLVANCATNGPIYDPFAGSGTTLIACEQLSRRCRAVEISPSYTAVCLQRWADATGQTPVLVE